MSYSPWRYTGILPGVIRDVFRWRNTGRIFPGVIQEVFSRWSNEGGICLVRMFVVTIKTSTLACQSSSMNHIIAQRFFHIGGYGINHRTTSGMLSFSQANVFLMLEIRVLCEYWKILYSWNCHYWICSTEQLLLLFLGLRYWHIRWLDLFISKKLCVCGTLLNTLTMFGNCLVKFIRAQVAVLTVVTHCTWNRAMWS